jgi:glyoxylate/hydroxypyruvate reductase A
MNITICFAGLSPDPWIQGLQQALPQTNVSAWAPGAAPADHAIVWAPPQQFIDEQSGLQTLFNIGAGVDALLQLKLPYHSRWCAWTTRACRCRWPNTCAMQ